MSEAIVYRKHGRKYIPIGLEFSGFPADGLWYYTKTNYRNSSTWLAPSEDIPALDLAAIHVTKEEILREFYKTDQLRNIHNVLDFALRYLKLRHGKRKKLEDDSFASSRLPR